METNKFVELGQVAVGAVYLLTATGQSFRLTISPEGEVLSGVSMTPTEALKVAHALIEVVLSVEECR